MMGVKNRICTSLLEGRQSENAYVLSNLLAPVKSEDQIESAFKV